MTREEAIKVAGEMHGWLQTDREREALETLIPELRESEDERIRKELVEKISNLACGCFISQEQKQKFIHYLEKQKEQKSAEWSEKDSDNLERVDNYLWMLDNYIGDDCAMPQGKTDKIRGNIQEVLSPWLKSLPERFNLQPKPEVECDNETEIQKAYREGKNTGRKEVFDHPEEYGLQPRRMYDYETGKRNPEWSEEDETYLQDALWCIEQAEKVAKDEGDMGVCWSARRWLKSICPSWKLSEDEDSKNSK